MRTTVHQTASTSLQALEDSSSPSSARVTRLDDACATSGGTGGLCLHCTGPESD